MSELWFSEDTVPGKRYGKVRHCFHQENVLYDGNTGLQDAIIFDNEVYGRILVLDGIVQFSQSDEYIYHDMLVHPVLMAHPAPRRVLIVGGGDGGTLREVLRHPVEEVHMVEIDSAVIELAKEHFPEMCQKAYADPRLQLHIANGREQIQTWENCFDVAFIDCSDPVGPSTQLYATEFYRLVARALRPNGIVEVQVGSFLDPDLLHETAANLGAVFPEVSPCRLTMPCYHCGEYCFMAASLGPVVAKAPEAELEKRFAELGGAGAFRYYSPAMHRASFIIPPGMF